MTHSQPIIENFFHLLIKVVGAIAIAALSGEVAAATKYASPQGSANASGNQRSDAWNAESCLSKLSPGDTCIYLAGNYGSTDFSPSNSGTSGNRIVHRCESQHGCKFDKLRFDNLRYVDVLAIASDSNFYDSSKSHTNPRMTVYGSHHLLFDSIYVRGEPQQCASGNPGPGCKSPSSYNRYNDLVQIGQPSSATSWAIEIRGASEFINGNHTVMQFHGDGDNSYCEAEESNIWVHGTPSTPIKMSNKFHHILSFKGACRVLVEYVDLGPAGTGRGDLNQPDNGASDQAGGIVHGATMQNIIVRYSNFSTGGTGTEAERNQSHIEVGLFGDNVNGACFPHNAHYRPWGAVANLGRINGMSSVDNVSILNNSVQDGWYLKEVNANATNSRYDGFLISRNGSVDSVSIDLDGIISDLTSARSGFLTTSSGTEVAFQALPQSILGLSIGSSVSTSSASSFYQDPDNWNFQPASNSPLIGAAVPIASTTSAGSGSTIPVNRPECFAGTLGGMRAGDEIDIGGSACTVTSTSLANSTISCSEQISWSSGEPIYYTVDGNLFRDIGSRSSGAIFNTPVEEPSAPKPPQLILQN